MKSLLRYKGRAYSIVVSALAVFLLAYTLFAFDQIMDHSGSLSNWWTTSRTLPWGIYRVLTSFALLSLLFAFASLQKARERQRDLEALRRSEKDYKRLELMFRQLTGVAKEAFWFIEYNPERIAFFNPSMEQIWGIKAEEFAADPRLLYEHIHPEERERVLNRLMDSVKSDRLGSVQDKFRLLRQDGTIRWLRSETTGMKGDDGQLAWTAGIMEDITDRVELEESLRKSLVESSIKEQRYRSLFENAPVSLWEEDFSEIKSRLDELRKNGVKDFGAYLSNHPDELLALIQSAQIVSVNKATVHMYHASSAGELLGNLEKISSQETLHAHMKSILQIWEGKDSFGIETVNRTLQGEERKIIVNWNVVPGFQDDYRRVLVGVTDITELKHSQEELLKSRKLFETFMENLPAAAWIKDEKLRFAYVNGFYRTYVSNGLNPLHKTDFEIWPQETAEETRKDDLIVQNSLQPLQTILTLHLSDGNAAHHAVTKFPIPDADDGVAVGGIGLDITERIDAERRLEESKEMYRELVESINEIVFSTDERGFITYISPFSAESFGLSPENVVGSHYVVFIHPDDLSAVTNRIRKAKAGITEPFECRFIDGDGITRWAMIHARPAFHDGRFVGLRGVILETTERKEAELHAVQLSQQLRAFAARLQNAREEERTLIAREIHDELGQGLTTLKFGLSIIARNLSERSSSRRFKEEIDETAKLMHYIDQLIGKVRSLATSLRPDTLDEMGLPEAIKSHADQVAKQVGIKCILHFRRSRLKLDRDKSIVLFRIFQEAFTNIIRHSGATEVKVILRKYRGRVKLRVQDNGRGIEKHEIEDRSSLGILGMKERALSVGGHFLIGGSHSAGTYVEIEVEA